MAIHLKWQFQEIVKEEPEEETFCCYFLQNGFTKAGEVGLKAPSY